MPAGCVSFQLSLMNIVFPVLSTSCSVGSARTPETPDCVKLGPRPRTTTCFEAVPVTVNPAIVTPCPVWTDARAEKLVMLVAGRIAVRILSVKF